MENEYRNKIALKIKELEKNKDFNSDVEEDPKSKVLNPNDVDYLRRGFINKNKTKLANFIAIKYIKNLVKKNQLIIKEVNNAYYLTNINSGCILTCNHFNPYDNFALHYILHSFLKKTKRKFYKVIKEGNYSFKGIYGYFFRNCDTLPLSSNFETMKKFNRAVKEILDDKNIILVYPEQSMWWNYKKPRPLKNGAFTMALKCNVPIVPCFITLTKSQKYEEVFEYSIHFSKPIYPDLTISKSDAVKKMLDENYQAWVNIYEEFYQKPLSYEVD